MSESTGQRLEGKVAVVTGAASGFGAGIARRFAAEGAAVVAADLAEATGQDVVGEIVQAGGRATFVACDVTEAAAASRMVATAVDAYGRLDVLINNAGYSHVNQPMTETSEEEFDRVFAVNVKAIYLAAREAVPLLRRQGGGCIINPSSTAALRPRPGLTWYNGSKGAVNTITKSMAAELAPDRIRVNAICPVIGATGMLETFLGAPDSPELREKFVATIPLGRMSEPADVAAAALFLASEEAGFITGVCLEVDGGRCV